LYGGFGVWPVGWTGSLEALKFLEGAVEVALAGIDHALETFQGGSADDEGVAGMASVPADLRGQDGLTGLLPDYGLDAAHTAKTPFVVDERIDQEALGGVGGSIVFMLFRGEFGEILRRFIEHDLGFGVDAVFQGVETRSGFARVRDGTLGFLSVGAAGVALLAG
jgi:hypothetical protein